MVARIVDERWDSRGGSEDLEAGSKSLIYLVTDAVDENEAVQLVSTEAPTSLTLPLGRLLVRQGFDWEPYEDPESFVVTSRYGDLKPIEEGEWDFSFDTTGGTGRITQAIRNKGNYGRTGDVLFPPDFKGAIGVTDDGVEGCEVPLRTFKWTETHDLPLSLVVFTSYSAIL
jgi:hypothetical protein